MVMLSDPSSVENGTKDKRDVAKLRNLIVVGDHEKFVGGGLACHCSKRSISSSILRLQVNNGCHLLLPGKHL